ILFNSRFRSYGAQGVLKKHPFCGAFLVFWGFKFLSIKPTKLSRIHGPGFNPFSYRVMRGNHHVLSGSF
ncbi:hypothetical protein ACTNAF_21320, partial [Escherichia coli]